MAQAYLCKLKHTVGKLPQGTTIQVLSESGIINGTLIGKEVERRFGKVPFVDWMDRWDIMRL